MIIARANLMVAYIRTIATGNNEAVEGFTDEIDTSNSDDVKTFGDLWLGSQAVAEIEKSLAIGANGCKPEDLFEAIIHAIDINPGFDLVWYGTVSELLYSKQDLPEQIRAEFDGRINAEENPGISREELMESFLLIYPELSIVKNDQIRMAR